MKVSLKQRIRAEAVRELERLPDRDSYPAYAASLVLACIDSRGSGPLPWWVRHYGKERGVE